MIGGSAIVRPWLKAGLSALLLESEERVLQLRGGAVEEPAVCSAPASRPAQPAPRPAAPASRPPQPAAFQPSAPAQGRNAPPVQRTAPPAMPAKAQPPVMPSPRPVPERRPAQEARPSTASSAADMFFTPGAIPVEQWPSGWLALKDRRPLPPRPLVLWSYAGLGDDLTGTPDQARRQVIVRMLTELRHPGGTHVFWPFDMSGEAARAPQMPDGGSASLFWSGVRLLDPRVLLLFGSDTRDALGMPRTLGPFCQERVYGRLVIQLPRPQALAEDEASFRRAQAFLARLLSFCAHR